MCTNYEGFRYAVLFHSRATSRILGRKYFPQLFVADAFNLCSYHRGRDHSSPACMYGRH